MAKLCEERTASELNMLWIEHFLHSTISSALHVDMLYCYFSLGSCSFSLMYITGLNIKSWKQAYVFRNG